MCKLNVPRTQGQGQIRWEPKKGVNKNEEIQRRKRPQLAGSVRVTSEVVSLGDTLEFILSG